MGCPEPQRLDSDHFCRAGASGNFVQPNPNSRANSTDRYLDEETAGGVRLGGGAGFAAMQPRDLPHQGKPETGSLAVAGELKERQEDALALRLGDAAARVDDAQHRVCADAPQLDAHRRLAVTCRV